MLICHLDDSPSSTRPSGGDESAALSGRVEKMVVIGTVNGPPDWKGASPRPKNILRSWLPWDHPEHARERPAETLQRVAELLWPILSDRCRRISPRLRMALLSRRWQSFGVRRQMRIAPTPGTM